jgi:hypothetical protein
MLCGPVWSTAASRLQGGRRVDFSLSGGSSAAYETAGLQLRSVAGNIAVATLALAGVETIARLPEVTFIELAQRVAPYSPPAKRRT